MPRRPNPRFGRGETRRQFIRKAGTAAAAIAGTGILPYPLTAASGQTGVSIVMDTTDGVVKQTPVKWAAKHLCDAFAARAMPARFLEQLDQAPAGSDCVLVGGPESNLIKPIFAAAGLGLPKTPECLALARGEIQQTRKAMAASGSDARGIVYALLELADRVNFADQPLDALRPSKAIVESPANQIRSIGRSFASDVEDKPWFNDRQFWARYLTMLATNRFNRFNLTFGLAYDFTRDITDCYFHFAYPFLLNVSGYNVRAVPLPDAERDSNLEMLRFASDEAARRGVQFQLGLWTHAYQWTNSPRANYTIQGLTPETLAPYSRDAIRMLLAQCPNITGVTIRTHGESGVAEGDTQIWKVIFEGIAQCGRKVEIDLHAKGINQPIIDAALATGLPVNISPKFWAEHMGLPYMQGAIRAMEMPPANGRDNGFFSRSNGSRSFLRYGYGDLFEEKRRHGVLHRIWPGTQRVLLWGDPETAAAYSRVSSFCESNGVEIYEPLFFKGRKGSGLPGGRDAIADATLKPGHDFEKYDYTYRVWGRTIYNPDADPDGWRRLMRKQVARGADHAEAALSSAGKILPLVTTAHCPSAANNLYWPEMYWDMQMAESGRRHPYSDSPSPKRFGTVSPLDPEFFLSCDEFADELLKGRRSGKYSPAWVAARLEECAEQTFSHLDKAKAAEGRSADFRRIKTDASIQAGLGRFFAAKFRAGTCFAVYLRTKDPAALAESLREYRAARSAWSGLANVAKGVYRDDVTYGPDYYQRGNWLDRLAAIDEDIGDLEKLSAQSAPAAPSDSDWRRIHGAMKDAGNGTIGWKSRDHDHPALKGFHVSPRSFRRGETLALTLPARNAGSASRMEGIQLRYRRLNQSEIWQEIEMQLAGEEFRAAIPARYSDSPFPLQYHFRIRYKTGDAVLRPGLETRSNGQPYYLVRQA